VREPIRCEKHGMQRRAFVCRHIVDTFQDRKPRGFVWKRDSEGEYEALCRVCSQVSPAEWERIGADVGRALCLKCFAEVGAYNGVDWGEASP
jgi:hypothetical protein